MTLAKGDHLVIKRDGKIIEGEAYHEYKVLNSPEHFPIDISEVVYTVVLLKKIE